MRVAKGNSPEEPKLEGVVLTLAMLAMAVRALLTKALPTRHRLQRNAMIATLNLLAIVSRTTRDAIFAEVLSAPLAMDLIVLNELLAANRTHVTIGLFQNCLLLSTCCAFDVLHLGFIFTPQRLQLRTSIRQHGLEIFPR